MFYLVDSLNVGGTESQAVELARRIPAAGYEVTLGCLRAQGPLLERLQGTAVVVREFHPTGGVDTPAGIYQLLRLSWFLRRKRFDIVHTHDLWSNLLGVPAARLAGVPAIVSSQTRPRPSQTGTRATAECGCGASRICRAPCLTNATPIREALIADDGFAPGKVRVIHNGVDIEKFHATRAGRESLFPGVGDGKLIVLVGNYALGREGASVADCGRARGGSRVPLHAIRSGWRRRAAGRASSSKSQGSGLKGTFYSWVDATMYRRFSPAATLLCSLRERKVYRMRFWNTWQPDCQPS